MAKLKAAVIGAGFSHSVDGREPFGARAVIPTLQVLKDRYSIEAVCTTRRETAEESARHFGVRNAYWDYRRLLAEADVDVVFIAVKPIFHYEIASAALRSGRHVYCEHPAGIDSKQALTLYQLARRGKLCTGVGHQNHHNDQVVEMRRLLKEGFIGEPLFFNKSQFRANMIMPRPSSHAWIASVDAGGRSAFRAGHPFERIMSMLGDVDSVLSDMSVLVKERPSLDGGPPIVTTQSNSISSFVRQKNGVTGVAHMCSTAWNHTGERLEIHGTEGMLMLTRHAPPRPGLEERRTDYRPIVGYRLLGSRRKRSGRHAGRNKDQPRVLSARPGLASGRRLTPQLRFFGLAPAYLAFANAIESGDDYNPGFRQALKLHRVFDALEKSNQSQDWEKVDYSRIR